MFELPSRSELLRERDQEYARWIQDLENRPIVIFGSDPAGLIAGRVLQRLGKDTLILEESEQIGGRLMWDIGPEPILSPADELLEELDYPIDRVPPVWVDRMDLLDFLLHGYLQNGGRLLNSVYTDRIPDVNQGGELEIVIGERSAVIEVEAGILSAPSIDVEFNEPQDTLLDEMVRRTRFLDTGWVICGRQALTEAERDREFPYINGELLSGRKAVECILAGE